MSKDWCKSIEGDKKNLTILSRKSRWRLILKGNLMGTINLHVEVRRRADSSNSNAIWPRRYRCRRWRASSDTCCWRMVLDGDSDRPFLWKMTNPRTDVSYNTSGDVKKDLKIDRTQSYFQLLQRPFGNVYYWPDIWNCCYVLYKLEEFKEQNRKLRIRKQW